MNPSRLFRSRVAANFKYQLRTISMVIDWTVALYIVIPAIVVGAIFYSGFWTELPIWMSYIPYLLVAAVIYYVGVMGVFRYFIQAGDQLFVIYHRKWLDAQIRYGFVYSLVIKLLHNILIIGILAPLLVKQFQMSIFDMIGLSLFTTLYGFMLIMLKNRIMHRWVGWRQNIIRYLVTSVGLILYLAIAHFNLQYPFLAYGLVILLILSINGLLRSRLAQGGIYIMDIELEYKAKTRLLSLIMKDDEAFKVPSRRKRPLLFRHSQRLFRKQTPQHGVAEFMIKSFYRNSSQMTSYIQLTFFTLSGLFLAPVISKWILWLFAAFMLGMWTKMTNRHILTSDFMNLFRVDTGVQIKSVAIASMWMALPAFLLMSICLGFMLYGWIGIPIMLIVAPILCKFVSATLSSF
ncbi:hypothetical protein E0485_11155 [Paenibacillus albiflavus]|uniref:Uncharacterized protein n=1 Tax=Paenibacillus albiflavus TaxID=2545760 RepID=A0A4R4ECW8_9BACL|nr:ABC transporter permease [Paenibacillus albiflavus]TCZ77023.1 hypothetical protein E0485_11155 [Paenibacillus albiflavus]